MSRLEIQLNELGLTAREYTNPNWDFTCGIMSGNLLFTSGHTPTLNGIVQYKGTVGDDIDLQSSQKAAVLCLENCLGAAKIVLGDLDRIKRIVKVNGFIASAPGFDEQAMVMNAVSEPLTKLFGEKHARSALGVAMLPSGVPVEVELVLEVNV